MKSDFNYSDVPYTFLHCMYSQCVRANDCLRHKVMLHVTPDPGQISIVNPARISGNGEGCSYFLADRKSRFAMGITHLLDKLPHREALAIKDEIISYFQRNTYYRIRNKERMISPAEQNSIRQIFCKHGIQEEPVYDEYLDMYEW